MNSNALLQNNIFRISALALVIFGLIISIIRIRDRIYSKGSSWGFVANPFAGKPDHVYDAGGLEQFGVLWNGILGSRVIAGEKRVYVEGPFCPDCETRLKSNTVPRLLIFGNKVWTCPACQNHHSRPRKPYLYDEKDHVRNIFERHFKSSD